MISGVIGDGSDFKRALKSLGIVFGDIGTSPIYTLTVIFMLLKPTEENVMAILSLIVWTLISIVTVKYVWLAMSLSRRGEGGTVVLLELLIPYLKKGRALTFVYVLAFLGVSLLIGDGIITPSITILSAVEGLKLFPGFETTKQGYLVIISALIAILLLTYQRRGTEKVAKTFAPIMLIWFISLFAYGFYYIFQSPWIFKAINPYYGLKFLFNHGILGFFTLSAVILCATGGEALYADMGHMKRKPITLAWCFVFTALIFNYMGQGAYLLKYQAYHNLLFGMVFNLTGFLYIPFLILSVFASVIASQAMISGIFSIVYQSINVRIMPLLKVDYTSSEIKGQIYISAINWFLLVSILIILVAFESSSNLASAYGFAVTGAMFFAGIMMIIVFFVKKQYIKFSITIIVTAIAGLFFASTMFKIPTGGYWSIILSLIPLSIILIYTQGQKRLFRKMKPVPLDRFLIGYHEAYTVLSKIKGSAIFLVADEQSIPPYILHIMFKNQIIYEDNILVSIKRKENPWGVYYGFKEDIASGLRLFEIKIGYMEVENIEAMFRSADIHEKAIFYGIEDIYTRNFIWKVFAIMKSIFPSYVNFYNLPISELHGVVTRVNM